MVRAYRPLIVLCLIVIPAAGILAGCTEDKNAALCEAAEQGQTEKIKRLLADGADVNAQEKDGMTALMRASYGGHTETAKLLLAQGADVGAKSELGQTALMLAARDGHTETVKLLLGKGADANVKDGKSATALMWASLKGHSEIVRLLLAKGADVKAKDKNGLTALIWPSSIGHAEIVKLLLARGADVNAKYKGGKTALMVATGRGHEEIVKLLKAHDARDREDAETQCDREQEILRQFSSRLGDMEVPANQDLLSQALETYYKMILARKRQEVNEQGVTDLTYLREQTVEFYKAGVVPKTDVLAAEGRLAAARGKIEQFGAEIDRLTTQLNFMLKYPLNREWETKVCLELPMVPFSCSESEIYRVAVEHRPDLLQKGISSDEATRALLADGPSSETTALVRMIMAGVRVQYQETERLWNVVPVRRAAVEFAAELFRINRERYKEQVANYIEILDAQRAIAQAQEDYYIDLINYKIKRASLERQLGILHLFELGANRNGE